MTNTKKILISAAAVIVLAGLAAFYFLRKTPRISDVRYETGSVPAALKAREHGVIPKWLPVTVTDIHAFQNLADNDLLLSFNADEKTQKDISETCLRADKSKLKLPKQNLTDEAEWWDEKSLRENVERDNFQLLDCGTAENMNGSFYLILTDRQTGILWNR